MKYKGLVGGVLILAATILLSALQICNSLNSIATATIGFLATSEPSLLVISLCVLSVLLLVVGIALVVLDLFFSKKANK